MKEVFIPYELAQELKKKGYPMPTKIIYATYKQDGKLCPMKIVGEPVCKDPVAPTIEQVLGWLRKEKHIHVTTGVTPKSLWRYVIMFTDERGLQEPTVTVKNFPDYRLAIMAGIKYVLENLI